MKRRRGVLNEKSSYCHKNETHNASTNLCVRYFDVGKEKQESDDISEKKALNDEKRLKKISESKQTAHAQNGKQARNAFSTKDL